VQELPYIQ